MLNRLRQRSNEQKGQLDGKIYYPHNNTYNDFYKSVFITGGDRQDVYDWYIPKARAQLQQVQRARRKLSPPPLNDVLMSKVVWLPPKGATFVTYKGKFAGFHVNAYGPNLGMYVLQSSAITAANKPPSVLGFTSVDPKVASYLLQRAYSKMSTAQYDFGVTLGEIAETAAFLAGPLSGIVKLSSKAFRGVQAVYKQGSSTCIRIAENASRRSLKRLMASTKAHPVSNSLRVIDESANHWLAYKFGVLPIIDDIGKAQLFSEENVARLLGIRLARAGGPKVDNTTSTLLTNARHGDFYYNGLHIHRSTDQHSVGLYWRDRIDAPLLNFVENLGFAPWQIPSLAWELVPLSFVVDRFIDIKSFVRGNIGSLTKQTFGSWCSRKIDSVYSASLHNVRYGSPASAYQLTVSQPLLGAANYQRLARVTSIDRPLFPVINPYWQSQLIADATNMALIWGRLRTHVGKLF